MGLNPTGMSERMTWNYSRPNDPGYSTTLTGTVCMIQEVQAAVFGTNPPQPAFWENRDGTRTPKMNIRIALVGPNGGIRTFTFQPASKAAKEGKKKSIHLDLFALSGGDMMNLIGKTIKLSTQEGLWGSGNPRPWAVELVDEGPYMYEGDLPAELHPAQVLMNAAVSGGQFNTPAPQMQPQVPQQPQYAQPTVQYQQQPMQQQYVPSAAQINQMQPMVHQQNQQMSQPMQMYAQQQAAGNVYMDDPSIPF